LEQRLILSNVKAIYGFPEKGTKSYSILIQNGLITKIEPCENMNKGFQEKVLKEYKILDCTNLIVLPGFVDSHTHLLFVGSREDELFMRARGTPYLEILKKGGGIYNTVEAVQSASEEALIASGMTYLDQALRFGTTTIEVKSGYGLDYENEKKMLKVINQLNELHPVDIIPTFLVHSVPKNHDRKSYLHLVAERMIPEFRENTGWFDLFLEKGVFEIHEAEMLIKKAAEAGYKIGLHTNQMHDIGGIRLAVEQGVRHVDHLEVLSDQDARLIIENETLYPVFLPCAEAFVFSEKIGQIKKLMDIPKRVVLSTDFNPGSSPVLSPMIAIMQALLRYRISDPLLLIDAFTSNPANMLFLEDRGVIEEGKKADLICMNLDRFEQVPYFGTLDVIRHVIKGGVPIFR